MPPEAIRAVNRRATDFKATMAGDVYTLGLLIFYVFTNGNFLFDNGTPSSESHNALNYAPAFRSIDLILKSLIKKMTQTNPKMRPSIDDVINTLQLLSHDFCYNLTKQVYKSGKTSRKCRREINNLKLYEPRWASRFNYRLFKNIKKDYYSVFDLLALIRNKFEHEDELCKSFRRKLRNEKGEVREDSHVKYFLEKVPELIYVLAGSECVSNLDLLPETKRVVTSFRRIQ